MQDLRVIGVESGALLVATDAGSEFRLPVTLSLHSQLRAADPSQTRVERKVPPRDIQARIRAGRSAEQVAEEAGVDLDYVRRFEGPVLAERSFVLETARAVPVSIAGDGDMTVHAERFGDVIDSRLDTAEATDRVWSSFKDVEKGWIVHVSYTAREVEREASWRFDPKKQGLAPQDGDAHTLSRQDGDHAPLVPRLRAVGSEPAFDRAASSGAAQAGATNDTDRFDSGAFEFDAPGLSNRDDSGRNRDSGRADSGRADSGRTDSARTDQGRSAASVAAVNRAPEAEPSHNQTADLLEALRRRRGEREAARFDESNRFTEGSDSRAAHPSTGTLRVIDVPLGGFDGAFGDGGADDGTSSEAEAGDDDSTSTPSRPTRPIAQHPSSAPSGQTPASPAASAGGGPTAAPRSRKGRASMPSWDEIVFGARSDDDPA